ncbi:MAG: LapA family protein [Actinomycetota bacterium]|nr:LapA family protein [Actinomycetota bacterium]
MSSHEMQRAESRVRSAQTFKVVVWLAVVAILVVFAFANSTKVDVDWVFNDAEAPLYLVIGASAIAGAILGFIARPSRSE